MAQRPTEIGFYIVKINPQDDGVHHAIWNGSFFQICGRPTQFSDKGVFSWDGPLYREAAYSTKISRQPPFPDYFGDVLEFHRTFGHLINETPTIPPQWVKDLRRQLIDSEYNKEFIDHWFKDDIVGIADDLADIIYVVVGCAICYGIPLNEVWRAVQDANMNKLWTYDEANTPQMRDQVRHGWKVKLVRFPADHVRTDDIVEGKAYAVWDETGKVKKPPSWKEPDIAGIIAKAKRGEWKNNLPLGTGECTVHSTRYVDSNAILPALPTQPPGNPAHLTEKSRAQQEANRKAWNETLAAEQAEPGNTEGSTETIGAGYDEDGGDPTIQP